MRRFVKILAAVLPVIWLTGCTAFGMDITAQLHPPRSTGEQGKIEAALEKHIQSALMQESYILKYPRRGDYRSAFIMRDLDHDGDEEALAFYRLEEGGTHVNLLHKSNGAWESVDDHTADAQDIDSVCFGDLNGDGMEEAIICYDMYSARTYQMSLYSLLGNRILEKFTAVCNAVTVTDMTADGADDCLFFDIEPEQMTASLWVWRGEAMEEVGRCTAAGYVQSLSRTQTFPLSDKKNAVITDYAVGADLLDTALIYWDGENLVSPLKDGTAYIRSNAVPCADMDRDGEWEWPSCEPLFDGAAHTAEYVTRFFGWDAQAADAVQKFSCIYNDTDGYYLLMEDGFEETFKSSYDPDTHTLWLLEREDPQAPALAVCAGKEPPQADGIVFETLTEADGTQYRVWFEQNNPYAFSMESLQYMLTLL